MKERRIPTKRERIRIVHWQHATGDFRTLGYPFECAQGTYDLFLHQTGYWPGIYSMVTVRVDDGPWVEYQKYRILGTENPNSPSILRSMSSKESPSFRGDGDEIQLSGDWCMVMRVELSSGQHTVWVHQPMERGYCPFFLLDCVELRPTETTETDWRWGVTELYRSRLEANRRSRSSLKTTGEVERYQQRVRENFDRMIGPVPEKGELVSRVTGSVTRDGFRIEKLWYQSQPGFYVTANLYLPETASEPLPAILHLPGHAPNGKAFEPYQSLCQSLVRKGYAVLCIDPVGQGERGPYYAPGNNHECQGIQGFLPRDPSPKYFIWDGVRAIDYLETRPEIDAQRIAVTGISGGGVQTFLLAFYDARVKGAVAMGSAVQMECLLWSSYDPDGTFYDGIREDGSTPADLIAGIAPRGIVIQNGDHDAGFPTASGHRVYEDVRHVWEILGARDNIACESPDAGHEINEAVRRNVYRWMNRWLLNEEAGLDDPPTEVLEESVLNVTPMGLVEMSLPGAESVWSLRLKDVDRQLANLEERRTQALRSEDDAQQYISDVRSEVREILRIPSASETFDACIIEGNREGEPAERVYFNSQGPMRISGGLWLPGDRPGLVEGRDLPVLVYLNQRSTEPAPEWRARILESGWALFSVRARVNPDPGSGKEERGTSAVYAGLYPMALKVLDLLRSAEYLRKRGIVQEDRLVYAGVDGHAGIAAILAGLLDDQACGVAANSLLSSFRQFLEQKVCTLPHCEEVAFLPGATEVFDIPDIAAALVPKFLLLMGGSRPDFLWPKRFYGLCDQEDRLDAGPEIESMPADILAEWLTRAF